MRVSIALSLAFGMATALAAGTAHAANVCETPKLMCSTTMPVGGFCECSAHGDTQDGTVVTKPAAHHKAHAAPVGCSAQSTEPGCR